MDSLVKKPFCFTPIIGIWDEADILAIIEADELVLSTFWGFNRPPI